MNQDQQNAELINSFLERTYYHGFRHREDESLGNWQGLEIMWKYKCNLGCLYCYVDKFGEELYPEELWENDETLLSNLSIFLDWVIENKFDPRIELFSGEPLVQPSALTAIDMILTKLQGHAQGPIVIPTNCTFILNDDLVEKVEKLLQRGAEVGIPIHLSASIDGKYCEGNRPFKGGVDPRDDAYYDKMFAFAKKWGMGFHPMIYSERIETWIDNFMWFQDMFKKHDIPWTNIYLLEVRNAEWSVEQIKKFGEFIEFLTKWVYRMTGSHPDQYWTFMSERKGLNILNSPLSSVGRGLGCSLQSTLVVRMGDLAIVPCHRTSYEPFIMGNYLIEDEKITGIDVRNPELWLSTIMLDSATYPYCEQCMIKLLCSHGCLGSQFETTGDLYTPIPTVCALEHEQIWATIRAFRDLGVYEEIIGRLNEKKKTAFRYMSRIIDKGVRENE